MVKGLDENKHFLLAKKNDERETIKKGNTWHLLCVGCMVYYTFVPNAIISS
jgi:hypothetical protein